MGRFSLQMLQMRVTGGFMLISNIYRGSLFWGEMGRNVLESETKLPILFNLFADCISPPFHPTMLVNSDGRLPSNKSCSMLTTVPPPLLFCHDRKIQSPSLFSKQPQHRPPSIEIPPQY